MRIYYPAGFILDDEQKGPLVEFVMKAIERLKADVAEVFIRAYLHNTTFSKGQWVQDPKGWYATCSYRPTATAAENKQYWSIFFLGTDAL